MSSAPRTPHPALAGGAGAAGGPQLAFPLAAPRPVLDLGALCDAEEVRVARVLKWGRSSARQVPEIAAAAGTGGRRVQEVIEHLLHAHGWPVGTAMRAPFGNYLIEEPGELAETVALLRMRGLSSLTRAAALRRMSLARYLAEVQTEIRPEAGECGVRGAGAPTRDARTGCGFPDS